MSAPALSAADQDLIEAGCVFIGGADQGVAHRMEIGESQVMITTQLRRFRIDRASYNLHEDMFRRIALKHSLLTVEGEVVH
jgi:hypothetical protein